MASLQEYLERQSDAELQGMLQSYCRGLVDFQADTVLHICQVLARRDPTLPDPYGLFLGLCRKYC